jgi:15-hydroxyprostaglandin dehydrogenase (NAD)
MENITGKNIFVFGGAGGMGIVVNKSLIQKNVGNLLISDFTDPNMEIQKLVKENKNVYYEKGDVSDKHFVSSIFKKYYNLFGYIDVVVNLAAILDENQIERTQQINVVGTIYTTYEAFEYMGKHRGGRGGVVVNTGSIAGLGTALRFMPVYCSTKHAVVGFCRCLMEDPVASMTGVKVVAICPGITVTPMVQNSKERLTNYKEIKEEALKLLNDCPIQGADQIAEALVYALKQNTHGIYKIEDSKITKITMTNL